MLRSRSHRVSGEGKLVLSESNQLTTEQSWGAPIQYMKSVRICPLKNREAGFWPGLNRLVETFSLNWSLSSPQQPAPLTTNFNYNSGGVNAHAKTAQLKRCKNFASREE